MSSTALSKGVEATWYSWPTICLSMASLGMEVALGGLIPDMGWEPILPFFTSQEKKSLSACTWWPMVLGDRAGLLLFRLGGLVSRWEK
jgi:hypothetical protein